MIVMVVPVRICQMISQLAVGNRSRLQTEIRTGLVQSYRIERCKHADIRKYRCVIFTVAVAVRGHIHDQADMEGRTSVADCVRVFRDLAAEDLICQAIDIGNCVKCTAADAAPAALADIGIDIRFAVFSIFFLTITVCGPWSLIFIYILFYAMLLVIFCPVTGRILRNRKI